MFSKSLCQKFLNRIEMSESSDLFHLESQGRAKLIKAYDEPALYKMGT